MYSESYISKTNLGLFLLNLESRNKLYTIMNDCENKYYDYNSENKQKITFERMPISPIFIVEKRELTNSNISCYSFIPLNKIGESKKVSFALPIDIDFTKYFKALHISENNIKALNHIEYNNIFQLLNKRYSDFDYKNIDDDYKMPYIYAISIINKNNDGINQRFQEIVKSILK